jgi:hypothetical protein
MVPSKSAPQELFNEWSCQYVSIIFNSLGNFRVLLLVTEVTIAVLQGLTKLHDKRLSVSNSPKQHYSKAVVGITWKLILDPGCRTLDCTAWIQSRLQAMAS